MNKYKGFIILTFPIKLTYEEKQEMGIEAWKSANKAWRYSVRRNGGSACFESEGFASEEQALADAENRIDAILDSL